jgi:hypothetical protein
VESAPRTSLSALLQAFTAGLQCEAAPCAAGLRDGEEGAELRPPLPDWSPERLLEVTRAGDQEALTIVFSYLLGRQRGGVARRRHALRSH